MTLFYANLKLDATDIAWYSYSTGVVNDSWNERNLNLNLLNRLAITASYRDRERRNTQRVNK